MRAAKQCQAGWARSPQLRLDASKAPLAARVFLEHPDKGAFVEVRPVLVDENQFRIGALPEQEVGEAVFAAGADDEVGIRQPGGIERPAERFLLQLEDRAEVLELLVERDAPGRPRLGRLLEWVSGGAGKRWWNLGDRSEPTCAYPGLGCLGRAARRTRS